MKTTRQVVLCICVATMILFAWFTHLESTANQQVDDGLKRALTSFATARALNAVISMVQGTEIAIEPAGVGVKISPGQLLRPLNDMVEQFAHLMLIASIAFGIERILMTIGAHWVISLLMTVVALGWGYLQLRRISSPVWLTRLLVILLMTRFAIPVAIMGSDLLFQKFMAEDYKLSQQVMETTRGQISSLSSTGTEDQSVWDRIKGQFTEIRARITQLKLAAEQATERIIKLMVIFILQTLLLPVLLLWALWVLAKGSFETPPHVAQFINPRKKADLAQAQ